MVPFNLGYHHLPRIIIIPFCPFTLEFNVTLSHKDHAINLMNHMTTFCLNMYHDDGHYCLTSKCCKQSWIDRFVAIIYFLLQTYKVCIVYQFVIQLIFFIHTTNVLNTISILSEIFWRKISCEIKVWLETSKISFKVVKKIWPGICLIT